MEKTVQLRSKAPRLLNFVSEGRHKKATVLIANPLCNLGGSSADKPFVGFFGYTVAYTWIPKELNNPEQIPSVTCPCAAGI